VVTTLLPTDAAINSEAAEPLEENGEPAVGEPMRFRLRVEAPGGPRETRFLHVLQGVDAGADADRAVLVESHGGTPFAGAVVGGAVALFPVDVGAEVDDLTYAVPPSTATHLITGLAPGGAYDVDARTKAGRLEVAIRPGTAQLADNGGVLLLRIVG
jgi:hypothetical protein